jgi:hypothetical protein
MHIDEIGVSLQALEPSMHGFTLPSDSQFQRLILVANAVLSHAIRGSLLPSHDDPYHY